jgi:hypothetical protein
MPIITIRKRNLTELELLVSVEDYEEANAVSWHMAGGRGSVGRYATNAKLGYCHRWVATRMGLLVGQTPGTEIDHHNGNRLNNQRGNLRLARREQNNANEGSRGGSSIYKGVSWNRRSEAWQAHIMVDYKSRFLGIYESEDDAARAYDLASLVVAGEFARPNLPDRLREPPPLRRRRGRYKSRKVE